MFLTCDAPVHFPAQRSVVEVLENMQTHDLSSDRRELVSHSRVSVGIRSEGNCVPLNIDDWLQRGGCASV